MSSSVMVHKLSILLSDDRKWFLRSAQIFRTYQAIQRMASTLAIKRGNKGYNPTKQTRERMSLAHMGHKLSPQHKLSMRTCALDEASFDVLTEEAGYWIGFLIADGNICYKKGIEIIALHLKDIDLAHLHKFREFVGSSHKVGNK